MKLLILCENGNNRSVQFAHLLRYKYAGSDTIPVGTDTFTHDTLAMLYQWADKIILVDATLEYKIPQEYLKKMIVWDVGPDTYPRPFNPILNTKARRIIEENPL